MYSFQASDMCVSPTPVGLLVPEVDVIKYKELSPGQEAFVQISGPLKN